MVSDISWRVTFEVLQREYRKASERLSDDEASLDAARKKVTSLEYEVKMAEGVVIELATATEDFHREWWKKGIEISCYGTRRGDDQPVCMVCGKFVKYGSGQSYFPSTAGTTFWECDAHVGEG